MVDSAAVSTPADAGAGTEGVVPPRSGWLLFVVLAGQFMALLDAFIFNVAVPDLRADLHPSGAQLQLIVAGYTITYAVLLITGARLGALLGHRRVFLAGLAVFTAASLACGLGRSAYQLIGFRMVQGVGAAGMIPQVLSLIQRTFTGQARLRALSVYSAVMASGAAVGQVAGGALVTADLFGTGWRPVFLVNVPLGAALLVVGARMLPRDRGSGAEVSHRLDLPGLLALGAAVTLLVVPLVLGREQGWPLWVWVCLALSPVAFAVFAAVERREARRGGAPLVPGRVLRAPTMGAASFGIFLAMTVNAGLLFAVALHLESVIGRSALATGLTFLPTAVGFGLVALYWRRLPERLHPWLGTLGFVAAAASFGGVALVVRDDGGGGAVLPVLLGGAGVGLGGTVGPVLALALAKVRPQDAADATGLLTTVTQLGVVLGVAAFGTVFLSRSSDSMAVTAVALAATSAVGALFGLRLLRGRAAP
ncbi:MFS transporter [Wenjunlia tyrosinilytica]|uniref:MFS transporter n=1 Tax=Wenjunlia tyrosinilytica TaxID=1544741 RepID=A0A918DR68_9ACTN|nr:MFS transporter [Wenjunlia tyrosinilytica]GGO80817.1 MFS transporter [Wenjunlia tyrosinilytica]